MKKTTSKKLLNYGTMSVALLGAASVSGQITYTDLEPDEIINAGEGLNIDVNGDGTNDFSAHIIASFNNTITKLTIRIRTTRKIHFPSCVY